ncbi:MAG: hypothetical protein IPJ19_12540 [Planctomycetes bacterium]|nr:hypothetical protein [Planctomycetota bacterium]
MPPGGTTSGGTVYDMGNGPELFVDNEGTVQKWTGSGWTFAALGQFDDVIRRMCGYDDGTGPALYVTGPFQYETYSTGLNMWHYARLRASSNTWEPVYLPTSSVANYPNALMVYDDGSGSQLYATGAPPLGAALGSPGIVRWNGSVWSGVGGGIPGGAGSMVAFDDGTGSALYVAVGSAVFGGNVGEVFRWDGVSWTSIGGRFTMGGWFGSYISSLAVFDDGAGPALYCGGHFSRVGNVDVNGFAKWNGTSWQPFGGVPMTPLTTVFQFTVHDDGNGPALYEFSGGPPRRCPCPLGRAPLDALWHGP